MKQSTSAAALSASGGAPPLAAVRKRFWGTADAPNGIDNFRRAMKIPNMLTVLKLDNGKVVSIADEQTDGQNHTVPC